MTIEEQNAKSVEAHKDIIDRFIKADDDQLKAELDKQHEEQAAPYVKELEDIIARKHQNGFFSEADKKRAAELLPLLDKIDKGEYESTDEGFQQMMSDSVKRIQEKRREQYEARKREREQAAGLY